MFEVWAVATSVAVAALDAAHAAHTPCHAAVVERRPRLAGHAALEAFSVLTRMPGAMAENQCTLTGCALMSSPSRCG